MSIDVTEHSELESELIALLETHALLEEQVGKVYVRLAILFAEDEGLCALWTTLALEEGGHAALLHAVRKGLITGVFHDKGALLPAHMSESVHTVVTECSRQAQGPVSLEQALRITWTLEQSELDFLRELLLSASDAKDLGFPVDTEGEEGHIGRVRAMIQRYSTDATLRREARFRSVERSPGPWSAESRRD